MSILLGSSTARRHYEFSMEALGLACYHQGDLHEQTAARQERLSIHYRMRDKPDWYEAKTENISRTGVLFRGEHLLEIDTPVEIRVETTWLPTLEPAGMADFIWRGSIVRTVLPAMKDTRPALAATISRCELAPGRTVLAV